MDADLGELVPDSRLSPSPTSLNGKSGVDHTITDSISSTLCNISPDPSLPLKAEAKQPLPVENSNLTRNFRQNHGLFGKRTIMSLPAELLTLVFSAVIAKREQWDRGSLPFDTQLRGVCRHWRDMADNTPALWTRVELTRHLKTFGGLRTVLSRSQNAPLELHIGIGYLSDQLFQILSPEMARTRVLTLHSDPPWYYSHASIAELAAAGKPFSIGYCTQLMEQLLQIPAPLLEDFSDSGFQPGPSNIIANIHWPRLRSVNIEGEHTFVSPICVLSKAAHLTTLTLRNCIVGNSVHELLYVLEDTPLLQHLEWETESQNESYLSDRVERKSVRLLELRSLDINAPMETTVLVMSVLDLSVTTKLDVSASFADVPEVKSPKFIALLSTLNFAFRSHFQKMFPNDSSGYDWMYLSNGFDCGNYNFLFEVEHSQGFNGIHMPPFKLSITYNDPDYMEGEHYDDEIQGPDPSAAYMEILLMALGWPGVGHSVNDLGFKGWLVPKSWPRVLNTLPALASIMVFRHSGPALFDALHANNALAPALQSVTVCQSGIDTTSVMFKILDGRAEAGMQPLDICLLDCLIEAPDLAQLTTHTGAKSVRTKGCYQRGSKPIAVCGASCLGGGELPHPHCLELKSEGNAAMDAGAE